MIPQISDANILVIITSPEHKPMVCYCLRSSCFTLFLHARALKFAYTCTIW